MMQLRDEGRLGQAVPANCIARLHRWWFPPVPLAPGIPRPRSHPTPAPPHHSSPPQVSHPPAATSPALLRPGVCRRRRPRHPPQGRRPAHLRPRRRGVRVPEPARHRRARRAGHHRRRGHRGGARNPAHAPRRCNERPIHHGANTDSRPPKATPSACLRRFTSAHISHRTSPAAAAAQGHSREGGEDPADIVAGAADANTTLVVYMVRVLRSPFLLIR